MTGLREGRVGPNDYPTEDEDSRGATCSVTSRDPQPRTLPTHAGDALEGHVMDITDDPNTIEVYDGIVETNSAGFERLGQDPVNVGLTRLCGCTGIFAVNLQAVYYAHYFENPSFCSHRNFQDQVIDFLTDPIGMNGFPSLQQYQNVFNNANTRVFVHYDTSEV
ncbi:MAG: hypothetical protein M1813_008192 [Trichoglossum hirsutum]|nr:MAG: hypothetical protein M1813_008192 [Trichoglossum hirsutum]